MVPVLMSSRSCREMTLFLSPSRTTSCLRPFSNAQPCFLSQRLNSFTVVIYVSKCDYFRHQT